ncbi:hypothetical protein T459_19470 [Capsicum annuum]|uniref:Uncharacterized protein n=1 Tax=Capsicum annuum TaxID=4072 RepID=A0A2G2Z1T0_CAPAN|nr:hypothetical protein T459_19470 [Capsicum annuum]
MEMRSSRKVPVPLVTSNSGKKGLEINLQNNNLTSKGGTSIHMELEQCVANFVRKPTTIAIGMGYVTNSARLPVLIEKGVLIINNSLNRNSIINGARESGATFCVFQHNTPSHLEKVLREHIVERQPRTHRLWKKIIVSLLSNSVGKFFDLSNEFF